MGPQDDPEAFLKLFELFWAAEAWGWPNAHWVACLLALLSGKAQLVAQQLPMLTLLEYPALKWVILELVSYTPQQHSQHFRSLTPVSIHSHSPSSSRKPAEDGCWYRGMTEGVVNLVVLEWCDPSSLTLSLSPHLPHPCF